MTTRATRHPLAFRVKPRTLEDLRRRAHESGESQTALAERYIEEGLRRDEHPLIYFRNGALGRRPALVGTRLDVSHVVDTIRNEGNSVEAAAEYLEVPVEKVDACLRYYTAYQDEIDEWAARARAIAEREEEAWRRQREVLG